MDDQICPGRNIKDRIFTLHQIFDKSWDYAKDVYACFVEGKKTYDWSLGKNIGKCWGSTVLTTTCYWASNHCILAQEFLPESAELNHNHTQRAVDSDKGACCHHSYRSQSVPIGLIVRAESTWTSQLEAAWSTVCFLQMTWYCLHPLNSVSNVHLIGFLLRATTREWK